jgi:hypothetical protein
VTDKNFRFLSDREFAALDTKQKALYLVQAQQELDERQRVLRQQVNDLVRQEQRKKA